MSTHEWITLIVVILGGFWTLSRNLTKIEVAITKKVGFDDCSKRQKDCPLAEQFRELKEELTESRKD